MLNFTVHVVFPALDRLVDFLEAGTQGEIDALGQQVEQLTQGMAQHRNTLEQQIKKEEQ